MLCRDQGSSILMITHDMGIVANMAHKVGVIYAGSVVETSPVLPLFKEPPAPVHVVAVEHVATLG